MIFHLDDLWRRGLEVPGPRNEALVHRRVLALQDHPVFADVGGAPRSKLPEGTAGGIRRHNLAHRERAEKTIRAQRRVGRRKIEVVDRDSPSQKLGAEADPEVELRVEVFETVGYEEVSVIHALHSAMAIIVPRPHSGD